jgi:hypothetical protein
MSILDETERKSAEVTAKALEELLEDNDGEIEPGEAEWIRLKIKALKALSVKGQTVLTQKT